MLTPDDVAVVLGRPTPSQSESQQWQVWIDDARLLIRTRLGDLDDLDQDVLDYVTREAVVAQVRKPDDATQVDVSIDDGRVSRRYASSTGRVSIIDDWWDLLSPGTDESGDSFSIGPDPVPAQFLGTRWY